MTSQFESALLALREEVASHGQHTDELTQALLRRMLATAVELESRFGVSDVSQSSRSSSSSPSSSPRWGGSGRGTRGRHCTENDVKTAIVRVVTNISKKLQAAAEEDMASEVRPANHIDSSWRMAH